MRCALLSSPAHIDVYNGASTSCVANAVVDRRNGDATLYIGRGSPAAGIPLEGGLISKIVEVCPLSDGRLVVFGDMVGAVAVFLIDKARASVVDMFWAFDPVISPDQRWIAYVKFYPLHGVEGSDQHMIYDLTKTPKKNRPDDDPNDFKDSIDVGRVVFPPGHENGFNTQLPEDLTHLGGRRIYWASDSRAILFEDQVMDSKGIALVTFDEKGTPTAFRHTLTQAETCGRDVTGGSVHSWRLEGAEIGPDVSGDRLIFIDLGAYGDNRCAPHSLQLRREAFQPAKMEKNGRPTYTRGTIVDGKEVIPPKKRE